MKGGCYIVITLLPFFHIHYSLCFLKQYSPISRTPSGLTINWEALVLHWSKGRDSLLIDRSICLAILKVFTCLANSWSFYQIIGAFWSFISFDKLVIRLPSSCAAPWLVVLACRSIKMHVWYDFMPTFL